AIDQEFVGPGAEVADGLVPCRRGVQPFRIRLALRHRRHSVASPCNAAPAERLRFPRRRPVNPTAPQRLLRGRWRTFMAEDKRQGRAGMILIGLAALIAIILIVAWFNWGRPAPGVET